MGSPSTLDREPVRPGREARLGALDCFELRNEIRRLGGVELVLVERLGVVVPWLVELRPAELGERLLDALALGGETVVRARDPRGESSAPFATVPARGASGDRIRRTARA